MVAGSRSGRAAEAGVTGAEVIVIGGGVMGASAAYWLTRMQPGIAVTVVEQDPSHRHAATALSVSSIRQQFTTPVNVAISRFGIAFLRGFAAEVGAAAGVASLGLRENGYLFLARTAEGAERLREAAAMQRGLGAATEVLSPSETAARFPWIETGDLAAASFGPRDEGWFDNMGLLQGLRAAARAQGARFVTDRALSLEVTAGRVAGVRLERSGLVGCAAVVVAAGTGTPGLMRGIGADLPVEPRKRTVFVLDAPNARHPDAPLLVDAGFYLRPEDRHWIAGAVPQDDGPCDINDFEPDLQLFDEVIWPQLYARAAGFDAVKVLRCWAGHYDYNRLDQNAILGAHPDLPNLYLMTGFSGHGLQQAPAVGRGIAEQVLTGRWQSIDLSDLGVARVLANRPFREFAVV
jgi:glycine/D-amino acid oxidase-like deaminating enzyme